MQSRTKIQGEQKNRTIFGPTLYMCREVSDTKYERKESLMIVTFIYQ